MNWDTVAANPTLLARLGNWMKGPTSLTGENWSFLVSKVTDSKSVYETFIKPGSKSEVNIDSILRGKMNALATAAKWADPTWPALIKEAKTEVKALVDRDTMSKWAASDDGKAYLLEMKMHAGLDKIKKAIKVLGINDTQAAAMIPAMAMYNVTTNSSAKAAALKTMNATAKAVVDDNKAKALMAALKSAGLV